MKIFFHIKIALICFFSPLSAFSIEDASKVLLLYPDSFYDQMNSDFDVVFRTSLENKFGDKISFETLVLNPGNRGEDAPEIRAIQKDLIVAHCKRHPPDLILIMTPELLEYVRHLPTEIFTRIPTLVLGLTIEDQVQLPDNFITVAYDLDVTPNVELAKLLQPKLKQFVVIGGCAPFDERLTSIAKASLGYSCKEIEILYWTNRSIVTLESELADLPRYRTAVYSSSLFQDSDGVNFTIPEYSKRITDASNVPVYSPVGTLLGSGVIGGAMFDHKKLGSYAADLVIRLLQGEKLANHLSLDVKDISRFCVDIQAASRWGINLRNLPADTEIINQPPSIWREHRDWLIGSVLIISFLAFVIAILLIQRDRILKTKKMLLRSQKELRHLTRSIVAQEESEHRHLAREIHDDIAQRVATLAMRLAKLKNMLSLPDGDKVDEDFMALQQNHAELAQTLSNLARRLHPRVVEDLGLCSAIASLVSEYKNSWGLQIEYFCDMAKQKIQPDAALTLYRVVQQSLANVYKHAKTDKARVFLSNKENGIQLIVEDEGIGFDANGSIGGGIGLSSMRERVMALNGKWELFSEPGAGTSIRAWVPNFAKKAINSDFTI